MRMRFKGKHGIVHEATITENICGISTDQSRQPGEVLATLRAQTLQQFPRLNKHNMTLGIGICLDK